MKRNIRIIKTGVSETTGPWARGVVDFQDAERMQALQIAAQSHINAPSAAFGMVNGLPSEKVGALKPGDVLSGDEVTVTVRPDSYVDAQGAEHPSIASVIRVAGKVSRTEAPVAECDW